MKNHKTSLPPNEASSPDCGGSIRQRQEGFSIFRLRIPVGNLTSEHLLVLARLATKYGRGELHLTTRQGIEIPWIESVDIPQMNREIQKSGFVAGPTGPHIRVITACPGNLICRHGIINARGFGERLDREYAGAIVPHKFKIAVSGCPNSCTKPRENDIGFAGMAEPELDVGKCIGCKKCFKTCREGAIVYYDDRITLDMGRCESCGDCIAGCPKQALTIQRSGLAIYIGGKMGRHPVLGTKIAEFAGEDAAIGFLDRTLVFYRREGKPGERLADVIRRTGKRAAIKEIRGT